MAIDLDIQAGKNLSFIQECICNNDLHPFYMSKEWKELRKEILQADHSECQICKKKGCYAAATIVHHVNHVRNHPELALSKCYLDEKRQKKRNLISVCKDCHETKCHPERMKKPIKKFYSPERW